MEESNEKRKAVFILTENDTQANVEELTAGRLSDHHEHHTNFVQGVVGLLLGACNSGDSLDDYCGYIQNVVLEMEKRMTYVKAIGDEMYRRLEGQGKTAA